MTENAEDTDIEELYEMLDLADDIIQYQYDVNLSGRYISAYPDDIKKKLDIWNEFITSFEDDDPPMCPSLSPQSQKACSLPDYENTHFGGHRSNTRLPLSWGVSKEDYERWRANS